MSSEKTKDVITDFKKIELHFHRGETVAEFPSQPRRLRSSIDCCQHSRGTFHVARERLRVLAEVERCLLIALALTVPELFRQHRLYGDIAPAMHRQARFAPADTAPVIPGTVTCTAHDSALPPASGIHQQAYSCDLQETLLRIRSARPSARGYRTFETNAIHQWSRYARQLLCQPAWASSTARPCV